MKAFLMLQDGTRFYGEAFGDVKNTVGEVVFSTAMSGYQANLCEPSFCGQIAVLTYPIIGDGGFENYDLDPNRVSVKGVVVKELCESPINWKNRCDIDNFFKKFGIVGIKDIDTRALTIKLREDGVMNGMICLEEPTQEQIDALNSYKIEKPVHHVTTKQVVKYDGKGGKKVAVLDFGVKQSIVDDLVARGHEVVVYPATTPASEILAGDPDGILLSNGPGDPKECLDIVENVKQLIGKKPIMGVCVGHNVLALAFGLDTYKLKVGHRGANQPVKNLQTGRTYILSQNHGYAVCEPSDDSVASVYFRNVNDGTVAGLEYKNAKAFSTAFCPYVLPGPMDTQYLYGKFEDMMEGK